MKKRIALWLGINLTVVLVIAAVLFLKMRFGVNIYCMTHQLFGLYCAGCGITRLLVSLVKGDPYTAFRYNPFLFITMIPMAGVYLYGSYLWIKNKALPSGIGIAVIVWGVMAVLFGILRNVPFFSGMLAPP